MKQVSREQVLQLMAILGCNANWSELGAEVVQEVIDDPKGSGEAFTRFLRSGGRMVSLTPTTHGPAITPPFDKAELVDDCSDEGFDIYRLRLLPALKTGESLISYGEAVARGRADSATCWGQRAAFLTRDAGNAGKISKEVWPVGKCAIFGGTIWRGRDGGRCAWCVVRGEGGFYCDYFWFAGDVGSGGQLPSLRK